MAKTRIETHTITIDPVIVPNSYTNGTNAFSTSTNYPLRNGYNSTSNTRNYARLACGRTNRTYSIFYEFDKSAIQNIPSNANITSVECKVRYRRNNTSGISVTYQLYSNNTPKGGTSTTISTTSTVYTLTKDSWTLAELQNVRLYIGGTTTSTRSYIYHYGAELTVTYEYDETINVLEIDSSVNIPDAASLSDAHIEIDEGDSYTLTITPTESGDVPTSVTDNNTNVTNQLVQNGNSFQYTISNISVDHTILVTFTFPTHQISCYSLDSSLTTDKTFPYNARDARNSVITITPSLPGVVTITDNGNTTTHTVAINDITSWQYTIQNVVADHTLSFTFVEKNKYTITATIDQDATISSEYQYPNISPGYIYEGLDYVLTIVPDDGYSDPHRITDNGVNVTGNIEEIEVPPTEYIVETASGASYGFEYNETTGYYTSTNKGVNDSAAVCVATFTNYAINDVVVKFINYAENPNYDYGLIGEIDGAAFGNTYTADTTDVAWNGAPAANHSPNEQTYTFSNVAPGTHTIYFKYRKDPATNSYNDDFRFKLEFSGFQGIYYRYTIDDVEANHNISVIYYATTYNINITNNGQHLAVDPVGNITAREGHKFIMYVSSSSAPLGIVITDNNVEQNVIPIKTSQINKAKKYQIDDIEEDHTITVAERALQNITCTSNIDNVSIASAVPQSTQVLEGDSFTCCVFNTDTTNHPKPIAVSDNYVDVTSYVVYLIPEHNVSYTATSYTTSGTNNNYPYGGLALGHTAENPYTTSTTNYVRASSNNATIEYIFEDFSELLEDMPDIDKTHNCTVTCSVYGRKYRSGNYYTGSNYAVNLELYSGSTKKGSTLVWPTDNSGTTVTSRSFTNTGTWTISELENAKLRITIASTSQRFFIGGITFSVEYTLDGRWQYTVSSAAIPHDVRVRYNPDFYTKISGTWVPSTIVKMHPKVNDEYKNVKKMFVKTNNQWRQINDI